MPPTLSPFRLLAFDVDGTLLDPDGKLRPAVCDAVRVAAAAGAVIALITGRKIAGTRPVAEALGVPAYLVGANGGIAVDPQGRLLWRDGIDLATAAAVVRAARARDLAPFVYCCASRRGRLHERTAYEHPAGVDVLRWFRGDDPTLTPVTDPLAHGLRPVRISIFPPAGRAAEFVDRLPAGVRRRVVTFAVDPAFEDRGVVEILPARVNKGRALARLARRLGVPRQHVLAFGDYLNDVEMLRWAGVGVAMGQAPAEVRAAADLVTASNAEDGIAVALAELGLLTAAAAAR